MPIAMMDVHDKYAADGQRRGRPLSVILIASLISLFAIALFYTRHSTVLFERERVEASMNTFAPHEFLDTAQQVTFYSSFRKVAVLDSQQIQALQQALNHSNIRETFRPDGASDDDAPSTFGLDVFVIVYDDGTRRKIADKGGFWRLRDRRGKYYDIEQRHLSELAKELLHHKTAEDADDAL